MFPWFLDSCRKGLCLTISRESLGRNPCGWRFLQVLSIPTRGNHTLYPMNRQRNARARSIHVVENVNGSPEVRVSGANASAHLSNRQTAYPPLVGAQKIQAPSARTHVREKGTSPASLRYETLFRSGLSQTESSPAWKKRYWESSHKSPGTFLREDTQDSWRLPLVPQTYETGD